LHAAGPFADSAQLAAVMPKLAYQVFFENHTTEAVAELNKDIKRSLCATLRTVNSTPPDSFLTSTSTYLGAYDNVTEV
jgi:soluble epoxide hydrolase/lipid-phosphate phosphatase